MFAFRKENYSYQASQIESAVNLGPYIGTSYVPHTKLVAGQFEATKMLKRFDTTSYYNNFLM
jgi:hypothetical protein